LYELELAGCNEITEAGLWACLTPRIVSLSLSDCINVADEAVGAVAQLLPSLYEFSLQAYHVTDAALGYFSAKQSSALSILKLQSCWELTNHGVVNIGENRYYIFVILMFYLDLFLFISSPFLYSNIYGVINMRCFKKSHIL